jgi:hypothetical protein
VLRQARERRGLTFEEVAADSRIPVHYIQALETDAFDDLPAPVYVRGFLRVYSKVLDIDSVPLLAELVDLWPAARTSAEPVPPPALPAPGPEVWEVPDIPAKPPAPLPHRRVISDIEDDWEPEFEPVVRSRGSRGPGRQKTGHLDGVLSEREPAEPIQLPDRRWIMLGGGAVVLMTVLLLGAAILRGAGGANNAGGPSPAANQTIQPGTVITLRSPTAIPSPTPSVVVSPVASGAPATAAGTTGPQASPTP